MIDVRKLELVKWLAFAAMVLDHVAIVFGGPSWLRDVGRFAMPAFSLSFGLGLAHSRDPEHVAVRLLLPALFAQVAWWLIEPRHLLNVLFLFAGAAATWHVWRADRLYGIGAAVVAFLFSVGIEGGPPWLGVVFLGLIAGRIGARWPVGLATGLVGLMLSGPGIVAGLLGALAPMLWTWRVPIPRVPGLLAWAYPAHLAVLAGLPPLLAVI